MATAPATTLVTPPPSEFLSADEFLDWLEPGIHADLIAGEIFMHSPVSIKHARLLNFVDSLLRQYIEHEKLGELFREVVAVKLGGRHVFLPDLCFFTNDQVRRLKPNFAPFAPALVVEALSADSELRDRRQKFTAYEMFKVNEYWILDPERSQHQFYRHNGEFLELFSDPSGDMVKSKAVPGFYLRHRWLKGPAFPNVADCLKEILKSRVSS